MERYTFSKSSRLLKPAEFQRVRREGGRLSTRRFNIYVLPNGLDHHRLGLSVSRRVGNAVVRNRVKRWLREYFRLRGRVGRAGEVERPGVTGREVDQAGRTPGKNAPLFALIEDPSDILFVARSAEGLHCLRDVAGDLASVRPARPKGGRPKGGRAGRPGKTGRKETGQKPGTGTEKQGAAGKGPAPCNGSIPKSKDRR